MNARPVVAASVLALSLTACATQEDASADDGTWVGTITTEGDVTTVVNESGSVWGGAATLVEELSIGVELGDDAYMFGSITGLRIAGDEIYVLDNSASRVHVYDVDGTHLRSFGRAGQGPGELGRSARDVAIGPDGNIYIGDPSNGRINIYSRGGAPVDEVVLPSGASFGRSPIVFAEKGGVMLQVNIPGNGLDSTRRYGFRAHTADGPLGDTLPVPVMEYDRRSIPWRDREIDAVPFAASLYWILAHDGSLLVGATDRYEFHKVHADRGVTIVTRFWDPVPVTANEAEYWTRLTLADMPDEVSWDGDNIPDHKPAFATMIPAMSGELWLLRPGPGSTAACGAEPEKMIEDFDPVMYVRCRFGEMIVDVFDADGRYLGEVDGFPELGQVPFIDGKTVLAATQDEAGTIMVKRYRLVLPGEE